MVIIGSGIGLSPIRRQAITCRNGDLLYFWQRVIVNSMNGLVPSEHTIVSEAMAKLFADVYMRFCLSVVAKPSADM